MPDIPNAVTVTIQEIYGNSCGDNPTHRFSKVSEILYMPDPSGDFVNGALMLGGVWMLAASIPGTGTCSGGFTFVRDADASAGFTAPEGVYFGKVGSSVSADNGQATVVTNDL